MYEFAGMLCMPGWFRRAATLYDGGIASVDSVGDGADPQGPQPDVPRSIIKPNA